MGEGGEQSHVRTEIKVPNETESSKQGSWKPASIPSQEVYKPCPAYRLRTALSGQSDRVLAQRHTAASPATRNRSEAVQDVAP